MFPVPRNHPAVRACFALTAIHVLQLSTAYRVAAGSPQDDEPPAAALLINICRRLSSLSLRKFFSSLRKILLLLVFCFNRSWPRPGKREIFRAQSKATFGRDRHATFWIPWQVVESVWTIPPPPPPGWTLLLLLLEVVTVAVEILLIDAEAESECAAV